jgi:hypothetical protein
VTALDPDAPTLSMRTDAGAEVTLASRYLDGGHLRHAYATTTHAVEGMTVDAAFFLGDARLYREMGYVGMSRGREDNRFYVLCPEDLALAQGGVGARTDELLAEVATGLGRSAAKDLALDTAGESGLAAASVAELHAEREALRDRLRAEAPRSPDGELYNLGCVRRRLEEGLAHARASAHDHAALSTRERRRIEREWRPGEDPERRVADWQARLREHDQREEPLRQRGADRAAYFEAHRPEVERYRLLSEVIERREARDIARTVVAPPSYITAVLGPRPERHHQAETWAEGVAVIQRHRLRHGITDPEHPLGREPSRSAQRSAAYRDAARDLDRASDHLARSGVSHRLAAERNSIGLEISRSLSIGR